MPIGEKAPLRKPRVQWPRFGEMTWLAVVAVAIVVLHVLAGSLLAPAAPRGSGLVDEATASYND